MRSTDSARVRWAWLTVAVLAATAFGAVLPRATGLVQSTYPGDLACSIANGDALADALTDAAFQVDWDSEPLFQHLPAELSFSLVYSEPPEPGEPTVDVACENEAFVVADEDEWDVRGLTSNRQDLRDLRELRDGSTGLTWQWEMIPRANGNLDFDVVVQPIVVVDGEERTFKRRNQPIRINVEVNRNAAALGRVAEAAASLATTVPDELTADRESEVSAELPLLETEETVTASIELASGPGSVGAVIRPVGREVTDGVLRQTWTVRPADDGALRLVFATQLSTRAGDETINETVEYGESVRAVAPLGSRLVGFIGTIGAVLGAVVAGLSIWGFTRRRRSGGTPKRPGGARKKTVESDDEPGDEPEPEAPPDDEPV